MGTKTVKQGGAVIEVVFYLFMAGVFAWLMFKISRPQPSITVWTADGCAYVTKVGDNQRITGGERLPDADKESCPAEVAP